jgi:hypothetical protein
MAYLEYRKFAGLGIQQNSSDTTLMVKWAAFWREIEDEGEAHHREMEIQAGDLA